MSYWRLFHNLIRHDDTQTEVDRATEACVWLAENILPLRRVTNLQQIEILSSIHAFWFNHRSAPSYQILKETLERGNTTAGIMEEFSLYDEQEDLTIYSVKDLGQLLTDMVDEWQQDRLTQVLKVTRAINTNSWKDPKTKRTYSGAKDAARYLIEAVESGIVFSNQKAASGALNDTANELYGLYEKYKADRIAGNLRVRTGIPEIDKHVAIKRGDFVGVLGYAGQRKSSLCRTVAYNAAMAGFNVLHISLEQTYDEERIIYGIIHSSHQKFGFGPDGQPWCLSKRNFDNGELSAEEEAFLRDIVLPDLEENLGGRLIIRQPIEGSSWPSIKMMAEVINQTTPIDLLFLDYIAICATQSRNTKEEIEANIKDAKQTALTFGDGRGVVFMTPVQGNRKGWEAAKETDPPGQWDLTGIYEYSELDRSSDLILSVLIDDEKVGKNEIAISSVKCRRAEPLKVFQAKVSQTSGIVVSKSSVYETDVSPKGPGQTRPTEKLE